jgi:hypothetical protein
MSMAPFYSNVMQSYRDDKITRIEFYYEEQGKRSIPVSVVLMNENADALIECITKLRAENLAKTEAQANKTAEEMPSIGKRPIPH